MIYFFEKYSVVIIRPDASQLICYPGGGGGGGGGVLPYMGYIGMCRGIGYVF